MVNSNKFFSFLSIAFLLFFALSSFVFIDYQRIALWISVPLATICSFFAVSDKQLTIYIKLQIVLYLWIAFTVLFAFDYDLAIKQLKRIIGCFLMIYSVNMLGKDYKLTKWLYMVFIVFYLGMIYYARTHLLSEYYDYTIDRMDDDQLNANTVAYFTFFITFIVFVMADMTKNKTIKGFLRLLFLISPIWSFIIALLTASRQVLIIQVPLILILIFVRYLKGKSSMVKMIVMTIGLTLGFLFFYKSFSFYEGSRLSQRIEFNLEDDSRIKHIVNAFTVGITHPIVGVGPGCYGIYSSGKYTFSHNNYLELFANCGLLALIICILMYWKFIKSQWSRYKQTKNSMFLAFFTFGVMYAIDNMFYVFYTTPWLMSFFFLVVTHSENYYQLNYKNNSSSSIIKT